VHASQQGNVAVVCCTTKSHDVQMSGLYHSTHANVSRVDGKKLVIAIAEHDNADDY
jgi:hypothetical protein